MSSVMESETLAALQAIQELAEHVAQRDLRDWFAGQALQGMNANPALLEVVTGKEAGEGTHLTRLTRMAYRQADAMMEARRG